MSQNIKDLTKIFKNQGEFFTAHYSLNNGQEVRPRLLKGILIDFKTNISLASYITEDVSLCFYSQDTEPKYRAYLERIFFENKEICREELGVGYGESLDEAFTSLESVLEQKIVKKEERGKTL